jgi:guanylate kinase
MFSVSACTRPMRSGEVDGKDYYFLSKDAFAEKIKAGSFLEYEEVYDGNFYGTLQSEIERIWSLGKVVVFDVDVYKLAAMGCNDREIAIWFDVDENTLRYNFKDILAKYSY